MARKSVTVYPNESVRLGKYSTTWSGAHDATSADEYISFATGGTFGVDDIAGQAGGDYAVWRVYFIFSSPDLPPYSKIISADFQAYSTGFNSVGLSNKPRLYNAALSTSIALADFDDYSDQVCATSDGPAVTAFSSTGYKTWPLSQTGLDWVQSEIDGNNLLDFGIRNGRDVSNSDPTGGGREWSTVYLVTETGTSKDPKLVITYDEYVPPVMVM